MLLKIVITRLLNCLKWYNYAQINCRPSSHEQTTSAILLELLEGYGVKQTIALKEYWTEKIITEDETYRCGQLLYDKIKLDFSTPFERNSKSGMREVNDDIIATLIELGFTWNGNVATHNNLICETDMVNEE